MRIIFVVLITILFAVLPVRARLGETEDQCIARYGTPIQVANPCEQGVHYQGLIFKKNNYNIVIYILSGRCGLLLIQKMDKSQLSDDEIQTLLDDNSEGHDWQKMNEDSTFRHWIRDDGAQAKYALLDHDLTLMSKAFLIAEKAREKAEDDNKLKGF